MIEELRSAYVGRRPAVTAALRKLSARWRMPVHALRAEANKRGWYNCPPWRAWTTVDDEILREKIGIRSVSCLTKALHRSSEAVKWRARQLNLSTLPADGFTVDDLAQAFGVGDAKVRKWAERGLLGKIQKAAPPLGWHFTEAAVLKFIHSYPHEYNLARVDQTWFKGMLFGTPGVKLAGERMQGGKTWQ
jgi:hypothetical protein